MRQRRLAALALLCSTAAGAAHAATFATTYPATGAAAAFATTYPAAAAGGASAAFATTYPATGGTAASAAPLNPDTTTQGAWVGKYGADGYILLGGTANPPSYATVTVPATSSDAWGTDPRMLTNAAGVQPATWTFANVGAATTWNVNLTGGPHTVSLYAVDGFNGGLAGVLTITDASSGALLLTQYVNDVINGVYFTYQLTGNVVLTFTPDDQNDIAISGIFFDPPRPVPAPIAMTSGQPHGFAMASAGAGAVPINIGAPIEPGATVTATVSTLPTNGTVALAGTAVTVGQVLTTPQLTALTFTPGSVPATTASALGLTLSDGTHTTALSVPVISTVLHTPPAPQATRTGVQITEVGVLVNDADPQSVITGAYYALAHGIPSANVVHINYPQAEQALGSTATNSEFGPAMFQQMETAISTLPASVQMLVATWTHPWTFVQGQPSITTALQISTTTQMGGYTLNSLFDQATTTPFTTFGQRPAMLLAAGSLQGALSLVDRAVSSFATLPAGTGEFLWFNGPGEGTRSEDEAAVAASFQGFPVVVNNQRTPPGVGYLTGLSNMAFYETDGLDGTPPMLATNTFRAGAVGDAVASYQGQLDAHGGEGSALDWIAAGATGSGGNISEPTADPNRFPQASVWLPAYYAGKTLGEAYTESVEDITLWVTVGDPLAHLSGLAP